MRHFALKHRISSFACAALAGVLFHPGLVSAVALGNIALQSSLGQPLRVVIPVALSNGETLNTACLKLVREPTPGTPQLLTGRVSVERNAANTQLIVTTPRAVDEPALRLSVQAGCGNTTRRDYVLLLDPQETESSTMASADLDEFMNYAGADTRPALATPRAQRVAAAPAPAAASAPAPTTFTPIAAPAPVAVVRTQKTVPPVPIAALAPPPPEPVTLTATQPQSAFIPEAAAASLTRVSTESSNTVTASPPTAFPRTRAEAPEETLWTQPWPYGAVLLSIGAIALTAFAKRRRIVGPSWGAPTVSNGISPMQNSGAANTFAHFDVMTEAEPIVLRPIAFPTVTGDSTEDTSLDTLLQEVDMAANDVDANDVDANDENVIDEHVIRKAWATLATESSVDIGTDSILKAIAAAERDLRISPPEPAQAAIDQALDDELMRDPKPRR